MPRLKAFWTDKKGTQHRGVILCEKNGFKIITCDVCEIIHCIPIPTKAELSIFYAKKFYSDIKPDYAEQHSKDREWWDLVYQERLCRFEKHLGKRGKILDIGCGPGFFLQTAKRAGWEVQGIEPSKQASKYARNLGVKCKTASFDQHSSSSLGKFDVIIINQSIEHFPNPQETILLCQALLLPEGLLCLVTANDFNKLQKTAKTVLGLPNWWVVPPEHINYFNINSLSCLIKKCGFNIINKTATFPIEIFLLMGENYIKKKHLGKKCHQKRKNFEMALERSNLISEKSKIYQAFAKLGLGREIEILGRKSNFSN